MTETANMCEREREISKTLESVSEYVDVCVGGGERMA